MSQKTNKNSSLFLNLKTGEKFLFTGGKLSAAFFRQSPGTRNYIAHFEEYIRWTAANNDTELMEQFVINTSEPNQNITTLIKEFENRIEKFQPTVVIYMLATEPIFQNNIPVVQYAEKLEELISLVLKLNNNQAKFVLQYPWKTFNYKKGRFYNQRSHLK